MAGHIQDRWFKTETDDNGKPVRTKSDRHGSGLRYRARYVGPDGTEKSKSFRDGQKRLAEKWLSRIEADMDANRYVDPKASQTTFRQYAEKWLNSHTADAATRSPVGVHLHRHAIPYLGPRPLGSFRPEHIREWLAELERAIPASSYRRVIFGTVSTVLSAAVDDGYLRQNPFKAQSVRIPAPNPGRIKPWTRERTFAVRSALPEPYRAMVDLGAGCGLRQGEIFGLPLDEVGFDTGWLHVGYQVKMAGGKQVFAPPKREKERDVPLPDRVASALKVHIEEYPPVLVTLPWLRPDGPRVTKPLLFTGPAGDGAMWRTSFNQRFWKPALADARVIPKPKPGEDFLAAREHGMHALRHFYASVLLDAGESVKALSTYLGHTDPGFTLRVYTHLMPSSESRTRNAVDSMYEMTDTHSGQHPSR
ncbi:site-specific integrase [Streptomyces sp. NPDC032198]|uniref:tyrosine-type recombinase/integrase n=1 Tax=Streptomyces sp. NPDC032198 TaxID=3155127 RepID=UPI0033D7A5D7